MTLAPSLRRDVALVALAALVFFATGLGSRDLWNPDEPRYAQVAREMVETGTPAGFFVPHLNGGLYSQKPPLLFWLMAASSTLTGGVTEVSARLPSALAATLTCCLVYLLGLSWFGRRAAWLAVAAFATGVKILWQGRIGQIDMLLISLVTTAVWCWDRGERSLPAAERGNRWHRLFFVAAGCATLAKGPVGLLPPLLAILAFALLLREREIVRRLRPWLGLGLWALVVLAWLAPAGFFAPEGYLQQIVFKQNVTRYADPWHHHQPWYYYLTVLPADFFPWSFLLPSALLVGWRELVGSLARLRGTAPKVPGTLQEAPRGPALAGGRAFLFALCWVVVTLVFFSLSPAKRTVYILTMYPALALLVGAGLDRALADWAAHRRKVLVPLGLVAGLLTLVAVVSELVWQQMPSRGPLAQRALAKVPELPQLDAALPGWLALGLGLAAVAALTAWFLAWRGRPALGFGLFTVGFAAACLGLVLTVLPRINPLKSARSLAEEYTRRAGPNEPYAVYPRLDAPVLFYTRRFAVWPQSEDELRTFAARPDRVWLLIEHDDLDRLDPPLPLVEVARGLDPRDGYVLMTQR